MMLRLSIFWQVAITSLLTLIFSELMAQKSYGIYEEESSCVVCEFDKGIEDREPLDTLHYTQSCTAFGNNVFALYESQAYPDGPIVLTLNHYVIERKAMIKTKSYRLNLLGCREIGRYNFKLHGMSLQVLDKKDFNKLVFNIMLEDRQLNLARETLLNKLCETR